MDYEKSNFLSVSGLDGMKEHNPKVVVLLGTNNRGKPELKGQDTYFLY